MIFEEDKKPTFFILSILLKVIYLIGIHILISKNKRALHTFIMKQYRFYMSIYEFFRSCISFACVTSKANGYFSFFKTYLNLNLKLPHIVKHMKYIT